MRSSGVRPAKRCSGGSVCNASRCSAWRGLDGSYLAQNGQMAFTTVTRTVGPTSINHVGQLQAVTVSFNLKPGVALGDAVEQVQDLAAAKLPGNIATSFSGTAKAFQDSLKNLNLLLIIAIGYIVDGVVFKGMERHLQNKWGLTPA